MAFVVQMVGLGRGDQDAVDAAREKVGQETAAAGAEAGEDFGHRAFEVGHRAGPGIQRLHGVDQHDLPVEPGDVLAEERLDHMRLVGLVAPLHHRLQRPGPRPAARSRPGSGAKVSAGEPSRSPGIRKRPGGRVESARSSCLQALR